MKAKIYEIFSSLQGEGPYAGVRQVFVRFFECHMHCAWCDTPAAIGDAGRNFIEMSLDEVAAAARQEAEAGPGVHSVSLTGGEPLLQAEFIRELCPALHDAGLRTYLETAGNLPGELERVIDGIDIVSMDIKLPSSAQCRPYWSEHEAFLRIARQKECFIKAVVTSKTDPADIAAMIDLITRVDADVPLILQPNTYEMSNGVVARCTEFQRMCLPRLPRTRVLPQMHKMLKIR